MEREINDSLHDGEGPDRNVVIDTTTADSDTLSRASTHQAQAADSTASRKSPSTVGSRSERLEQMLSEATANAKHEKVALPTSSVDPEVIFESAE